MLIATFIALIIDEVTDGYDEYTVSTWSSETFFYASNFPPCMIALWRFVNSICIVISLAYGPIYWFFTRQAFQTRRKLDIEEHHQCTCYSCKSLLTN